MHFATTNTVCISSMRQAHGHTLTLTYITTMHLVLIQITKAPKWFGKITMVLEQQLTDIKKIYWNISQTTLINIKEKLIGSR